MLGELTRHNHFVPVWYQRGFLPDGKGEHYVLDKEPDHWIDVPGHGRKKILRRPVTKKGPIKFLQQRDLYTTNVWGLLNDDVERLLFGRIDANGRRTSEMLIQWPMDARPHAEEPPARFGNPSERMLDLTEYLGAQKFRTPKGLTFLKVLLAKDGVLTPNQNQLMTIMQSVRQYYATTWAEGFWELVSAERSDVKFIFSDDPVVLYNCECLPDARECVYPYDPHPYMIGTRTLFPINNENCLIISNIEYARNPSRGSARKQRRNARSYDDALITWLDIHKNRFLTEQEVATINYIVKQRAVRFVAAGREEWLYPEKMLSESRWDSLDNVLQHKGDPWKLAASDTTLTFTDDSIMTVTPHGERDVVPGWFVRRGRKE